MCEINDDECFFLRNDFGNHKLFRKNIDTEENTFITNEVKKIVKYGNKYLIHRLDAMNKGYNKIEIIKENCVIEYSIGDRFDDFCLLEDDKIFYWSRKNDETNLYDLKTIKHQNIMGDFRCLYYVNTT